MWVLRFALEPPVLLPPYTSGSSYCSENILQTHFRRGRRYYFGSWFQRMLSWRRKHAGSCTAAAGKQRAPISALSALVPVVGHTQQTLTVVPCVVKHTADVVLLCCCWLLYRVKMCSSVLLSTFRLYHQYHLQGFPELSHIPNRNSAPYEPTPYTSCLGS